MRSWAYRPRLANGELVPLSSILNFFRLTNHIYWPLEDDLSRGWRYADRIAWILGFLIFQFHNEAELRYLWQNFNNIEALLAGMATYIVLLEAMMRCFYVALNKDRLKQLLKHFYTTIYLDENVEPISYRRIQWKMLPTKAYALLYLSTIATFAGTPLLPRFREQRETLYHMAFPYDHTPLYIFVPLTISSIYVGIIVATMMFGDGYLLAELILHLNERFCLLQRDLRKQAAQLLHASGDNAARDFQSAILKIVERNQRLHEFAVSLQAEFSNHIFILFSVSASLLCALGFKTYTSPADGYAYLFWVFGKIMELLAIGEVGSTIIYTTQALSEMYYTCGWEQIIAQSSNTLENVRLMKLILCSMEMHRNSFVFTGFNFFRMSLEAVLMILRAAGSYFTCLIALR